MQGVSERASQWYSESYFAASITKMCTPKGQPLCVNVFVTLATQQNLEYHCKALFETPYVMHRGASYWNSLSSEMYNTHFAEY
jgi:hypothetical protein